MQCLPIVFRSVGFWLSLAAISVVSLAARANAGVVINEIHYHPVEEPAFNADGTPVLDLSDDVHEFIELFNAGTGTVSLAGWRLAGGISYDFAADAQLAPNQYLVVAKNPARLALVYGLAPAGVLGPYGGVLGNGGDAVRLEDQLGNVVEAVSYSARFPWAISADALGAQDEWTGLISSNYQYRGRSLERVSVAWPANDPANWLASPLVSGPSPGRANAVSRAVPRPVVTRLTAAQNSDGARLIRAGQAARIDCTFSATNGLSSVQVEYFLDDINSTIEAKVTVAMSASGAPEEGRFTATLPGQADRTLIRYRIRADRGAGLETVSPRADDPFGWHACFVTPVRSGNPAYDCFISTASLNTLATNLFVVSPATVDDAHFRRVTSPDPPGVPRTTWNATEPAVLVYDGEVYDGRARYHGSQYRRAPVNNSWKWQFPRYKPFQDRQGVFISDNDDITVVCGELYRRAGVPQSYTKWIDFYLNNAAVVLRLDQDEMDDALVEHFFAAQQLANPDAPTEGSGEFYKAQGNFLFQDPWGPFGYGGYKLLPARSPYWTELDRYEATFGLQMHGWKGYTPFYQMLHELWAARGDAPTAVNPNLPALRAYLSTHFEVDQVLTCLAVRVWCGGWDIYNHNSFVWRHENGKWSFLTWDFDFELGLLSGYNQTSSSIYSGESGVPPIYTPFGSSPAWVDANWINDSFFKAFREEYKQKLFFLNNTLLNPTNISALGFTTYRSYADARFASINSQLGLGPFYRPNQPVHLSPTNNVAALPPAQFVTSAYGHGASPAPAHASTTWSIRSATGNYDAPVFRTTSTSNLTSLSIPFDRLSFGQTYFWKVVYTDTNGRPSLDSLETAFIYGATPVRVALIDIDASTLWRYNISGSVPANWASPGFDDSAWAAGAALLADETAALPEPIRTPFSRGTAISFYFRHAFNFQGDPATASLRLRHIVDDGAVVYLNGAEVWRIGLPTGTITPSTPASRAVGDAVYEGPFTIPATSLVAGVNVMAVEVHQQSASSTDVTFGLSLEAYVPPPPGSLVINEVLADNRGAVLNGGYSPDFIELRNTTSLAYSLNGVSISDDVSKPGKFVFPPNVSIPPQGTLVLWCDDATNAPGLHSGFALDNDGQTVALFMATPQGYALGDSLAFGLQTPNFSIGRVPDGSGAWQLTSATPGMANVAASLGVPSALKVNEWLASDPNGPDWFEIYNSAASPVALGGLYLSDKLNVPTVSRVPNLSFLGPRSFRQFIADQDPAANARHVNFKLSANGETIGLFNTNQALLDSVTFGPQTSGVSQGRLPDGGSQIVFFPNSVSPEAPNYVTLADVVINELAPDLELRNRSVNPVDVSGWWLSDDLANLQKYQIPPGVVIPGNGYWWVDDDELPFSLRTGLGARVYLSRDATTRTSARVGPYDGLSYGTVATSVGEDFVRLHGYSFGFSNAGPEVGPVVISEIQYHPPNLPGDNDDYEFVELLNISGAPVNLFDSAQPENRWRLRDAVSYTFPPGTTLATGERVLLVGFDLATNAVALSNFNAVYHPTVRLFGPYSGKLDNAGASVELIKPGASVTNAGPDYGQVPEILIDRVHYLDVAPWPVAADGAGASLQRAVVSSYGNDPTNWFASGVSPGGPSRNNAAPTVSVTSPTQNQRFNAFNPLTLAATASDPDGAILRVEFYVDGVKLGEDWQAPFSAVASNLTVGLHVLTAKATDSSLGTATSAPVVITMTNAPPSVALIAPADGQTFSLPGTISLQATATDNDGSIVRVEFFAGNTRLGEDTASPFSFAWSNAPAGTVNLTARATDSFGLMATSAPVSVTLTRLSFVAYVVPAGTPGASAYNNSIGLDFDVVSPILVTALGMFDSAGDGVSLATTLTTQLYRRSGNSGTLLVSSNFTGVDPGVLDGGSRFKALPQPLVLSNGNYSIVGYGFGMSNRVGDASSQTKTWTTDNGGGLIDFVGTSRYGTPTPGTFPATPGGVSVNDFATGTFEFRRLPTNTEIIRGPADQTIRAGLNATFSVLAFSPTAPLAYQWMHDGTPLAGGTSSSFTVNNAQLTDQGGYSVVVSSPSGVTTSAVATLTVILPVTFVTQPENTTVVEGGTATFRVTVAGTPPFTYRWLRNGAPFVPFPASPVLTITNVPLSYHSNFFTAIATNQVTFSASSQRAYLFVLADFDRDGIADSWEAQYGLDTNNVADATLDFDHDGMDNRSEFLAGTDPLDPQSYFKVDRVTASNGVVSLEWLAVSNRTYSVLYKDALDAAPWSKLVDVPMSTTNHVHTATDSPGGLRLYRLATPALP